jgi:hypothetical protein
MPELMDLVPVVEAPVWGAWEPLALTMLLSGGVSFVAAGAAAVRKGDAFCVYLLSLTGICSVCCGLLGVFAPLEQPLRVWEFAAHPAFSSWTARGFCCLPLCLACGFALLWLSRRGKGIPLPLASAMLVSGGLIPVYVAGEVQACAGRALWLGPWSLLALLVAAVVGASGLTLLIGVSLKPDCEKEPPRKPLQGSSRVSFVNRSNGSAFSLSGLGGVCAGLAFLCAATALLLRAPHGYAAFVDPWWHAPEAAVAFLGVGALALGKRGAARLGACGGCALAAAVLLLWKLIHMGEIFGRNASLYPARSAFADLLTSDALAAFGGTMGMLVVSAVVVPFLMPPPGMASEIDNILK